MRKHKTFKQLASYGLQCLEKVLAPPKKGWEANAKAAFALGAAEDIADVAQRFWCVCSRRGGVGVTS